MIYALDDLRYSFYEISEILKRIPKEYNNKIPEKIIKLINDNKINNNFIYNTNKTLDNQEMLHSTKIILSILYRTYWCSEEKRRELEEKDNNILKEKYNPNNIFKNYNQAKNIEEEIVKNEVGIVEYKESLLKKIINKIKNIFLSNEIR